MTIPFDKLGEEIANTLMAANYKVEMFDDSNKRVYEKQAARKFFTRPGNHMISLHDEGNEHSALKVFLSSPVNVKEFQKKVGKKLRDISTRTGDNMSYDIRAYGRELTLKDFAHDEVREEFEMNDKRMDEAYTKMTGTSRSSYQKIGECRIIVRHIGRVNEAKFGSRSRNIASIYVETKDGERFRMVENSLHGARAMARHLSNSGNPYDVVGKKISGMMEEMASLRDMIKEVRAIRKNDVLSEEGNALSQQIREKYVGLRETLRKMSGKIGYRTQTAGLEEEERLVELEPKPWGKGVSIRKQLGRDGAPSADQDDVDTALAYGGKFDRAPTDTLSGAIAITPPSTGGKYTGADNERIKRQAASDWLRRAHRIEADPTAPEYASSINSALASPDFLNSPEYKKYEAQMGESIVEDEFDVILGELYDDSMDPVSGTEKGPMDLEALRQLPPMKQFSLLFGEIISPYPHGNPQIDAIKKKVEAMLRKDDEQWNYWNRANDNITHGDPLQSEQEKQAAQQAAQLLTDGGLGDFSKVAASLNVAGTPHKRWGEEPGDVPTYEAKQVGGKWGNERASDVEDKMIKRMSKRDIQAGSKRKEREPDKYDKMAKKYGVESVQEDGGGEVYSAQELLQKISELLDAGERVISGIIGVQYNGEVLRADSGGIIINPQRSPSGRKSRGMPSYAPLMSPQWSKYTYSLEQSPRGWILKQQNSDQMEPSENIHEAEAEGKITSAEQKYEYTSNVSEFDRPTDGDGVLVRNNAEHMHSENDVEIAKGGGKQKEYPLPEHAVLESWFDDMARVEFFNEEELKDDEDVVEETKLVVLPEDAITNLNMSLNMEYDDFGELLKTYEDIGILDEVVALVEEDSTLWKAIDEGRVSAMWMDQQEQKMDVAFAELESIVQRRAQSLETAIQELAQDFDDPDAAAEELHIRAGEAGLEKSDFGSTFADDVLSPNEEVARGKEQNKAEEFYGRAKFGEGEDEEVARIRELAGLNDERQIDEYPGPESNMGGSSQGEVYDPETNELIGSVWQVGPGNWEIEHNLSGMTWDMHDTEPDAIEHLQQIHNEHGAQGQVMHTDQDWISDTDPEYYESVDRIQELAGIAKKKNDDVEEGWNDHVMGPGYEDENAPDMEWIEERFHELRSENPRAMDTLDEQIWIRIHKELVDAGYDAALTDNVIDQTQEHMWEKQSGAYESVTEAEGCGCGPNCKCGGDCKGNCGDENCPCECKDGEPDLEEHVTDQNLARIIQLSKYRSQ